MYGSLYELYEKKLSYRKLLEKNFSDQIMINLSIILCAVTLFRSSITFKMLLEKRENKVKKH